jgi:hypothetical protein
MHSWQGPGIGAGRVTAKGIEVAVDGGIQRITWKEVLDVIKRGASPERVAVYMEAHRQFGEWAKAGGYGRPVPPPPKDDVGREQWRADREAEHAEYSRVTDALRETTRAIIDAGCQLEPVQEQLVTSAASKPRDFVPHDVERPGRTPPPEAGEQLGLDLGIG